MHTIEEWTRVQERHMDREEGPRVKERDMDGEECNWRDATDSAFGKQLEMSGITPLHRIAIAVSGGADSMALCLLAARWMGERHGCLVGFVVDHALRPGSAEEAIRVKQWVTKLGLECHILKCVWIDGVPAVGRLQESARNARYALLGKACQQSGRDVLLTAHHADDQAELFILRLSRCSGIAGLAGMASAVSLDRILLPTAMKNASTAVLVLSRPLLKFVKEDLYRICQEAGQDWVEDPTNLNRSFARNRIRTALQNPPFMAIRTEIQNLISFCRSVRISLDEDRDRVLSTLAWVSQEWGHATIDTEKLASVGASDAVLHRALGALLQFVAQRPRAPRGRVVRKVLDRLRDGTSKGGYTAGGCNIFPAPRSEGSVAIISFCPESPQPSEPGRVSLDIVDSGLSIKSSPICTRHDGFSPTNLASRGDLTPNRLPPKFTDTVTSLQALDMTKPWTADDFSRIGLISDTGASLLSELALDLSQDMGKQPSQLLASSSITNTRCRESLSQPIFFGQSQHFMDRFLVSLSLRERHAGSSSTRPIKEPSGAEDCCLLMQEPTILVRHFEERDWFHLSRTARNSRDYNSRHTRTSCYQTGESPREQNCFAPLGYDADQTANVNLKSTSTELPHLASDRSSDVARSIGDERCILASCGMQQCVVERLSKAKQAIARLKKVPKPVRKGLPVFVTAQGLLLGIPWAMDTALSSEWLLLSALDFRLVAGNHPGFELFLPLTALLMKFRHIIED